MNIRNVVIGIAIVILTISVVIYGIGIVYEKPQFKDFCGEFKTAQIIENQSQCESIGGKWTPQDIRCVKAPCPQGYCDRDFTCRQEYGNANEKYSRNIFLIALPVGILLIVGGALVFGLETVGAGLMGGGVGVILYGIGNYWRYSGDVLKFALSLIGLIAVIYFAYWFNKKR